MNTRKWRWSLVRGAVMLALWPVLSGCTRQEKDAEAGTPSGNERIAELEQEVRELNTRREQEVAGLRQELQRREAELGESRQDFNQQLQLKDQRIAGLEEKLKELTALNRTLSAPPPVPLISTVTSAASKEATSVSEDRQNRPEPFPVRVTGVAGRQAVVGTHAGYRTVETDEIYRDEYGNKKNRTAVEELVVTQYAFQVLFSLENISPVEHEVTVRAGQSLNEFRIPGGGSLTNLAVEAARGSGLRVTVGSETRTFPVSYP